MDPSRDLLFCGFLVELVGVGEESLAIISSFLSVISVGGSGGDEMEERRLVSAGKKETY